ncbi:MAG: glycosyltransferase [Lachnospiraceae bacterium]|nr:glycosyltransferase [Lachnospiraceae bacterium]
MNISQRIINLSEKMRPVLIKLIPRRLLRGIKSRLTERSLKRDLVMIQKNKYIPQAHPHGINLIGCVQAEIGLGQSCRLLANELEHTGIEYSIHNFKLDGELREEDHSYDHKIRDDLPYGINIFHIEPLDLAVAFNNTLDVSVWKDRYNIAFWLWELEEFPKAWVQALELVDEIWTPSEFASRSVRTVTDKPVYTIPYHITAPIDNQYNRRYFKLPEDQFLFLVMYDTNSTMARKNPMGAIEAFKRAFSPEDKHVGLVLKMNNPKQEDIEELQRSFGDYRNIYYITDIMDKVVVNSLIACVDVFVSLHRAEGFGLVMAEAMLNGTPCIATNWSSNTEFMNEEVACMVDYTFTVLEKDAPPYDKGVRWADANTDTAARYMRRLTEDRKYYETLAVSGRDYIMSKLGIQQAVDKITERIRGIEEQYM